MQTVCNTLILVSLCTALAACTQSPTSPPGGADAATTAEAEPPTTDHFVSSFQTLSEEETRKLEKAVLKAQKPKLYRFYDPFSNFSPKDDNCGRCYSEYAIALNADEAVLMVHLGGSAVLPTMAGYRVSRHPPYPSKPLQLPGIIPAVEQKEQFLHIGHNLGIDADTGIIWQGIYNDMPLPDCEGCGDIDRKWRFDGQNFQLTKSVG